MANTNGNGKTERPAMTRTEAVKRIIRILDQLPSDQERARVGEMAMELSQMSADRS